MRKKWLVWILVVLVVAGAAGGFYYYNTAAARSAAAAKQPVLHTASARQGDLTILASGTGQVIPAEQMGLGFDDSGTLTELHVKIGDQVKKGDVLARMQTKNSPASIAAAIADAQNQVLKAQKALDDLKTNAGINRTTALNDVTTYAKAVRDAQYNLDVFNAPPELAKLDPMQSMDVASQELARQRAAFEPYRYGSSTDSTRALLLKNLNTAQANYDTALKRLQLDYLLEVAQANLTKARSDYDLYKNGPAPADVALAQSDLDNAKAKLALAQSTLAFSDLVAPADGTVMDITANVGENVGTASILTLASVDQTQIQVYLDETDLDKVAVGNEADVTFDAVPGKTFIGKVTQVNPGLTTVSNVQVIKALVTLDPMPEGSHQLLPVGLNAAADIIAARARNAVLVPREALKELDPGQYAVYVASKTGQLSMRVVKVGLMDDTMAQILSGLNAGESVSTGIVATK